MNRKRCYRLIEEAVKVFELDLSGLTVLTEAATGYFVWTPIIASLAGAKQVLALTRASRFGSETDVISLVHDVADECGAKNIEVLLNRSDSRIADADLITNLGFVRPIDRDLIEQLKPNCVISLMWEPWEFRAADLDLVACRERGIAILGTNEEDLRLQTMRYVGHLVSKLLLELEVEVMLSKVVVVGSGKFGHSTVQALSNAGAEVVFIDLEQGDSLAQPEFRNAIRTADAIAIVEHTHDVSLIGPNGQLSASLLAELNPAIVVVHVAGAVDGESLRAAGIPCNPKNIRPFGFMSQTTAYLGPRPMIDLHTAGLKVGEALARERCHGQTVREAEQAVAQKLGLALELPSQGGAGEVETADIDHR